MRAYYGSRFSANMTRTPEGFLVCHNVPIARTGWYEYLADELGLTDAAGKIVKVYRSPEVVFSSVAMASFEGKILTDEHPLELVTPENATRYSKGGVQNVRQGSGGESDLLIADLIVYDQALIEEIQDGKREVSCGYDCVYVPRGDGTYSQEQVVGNHVAIVKSGRAGNRVAIKDSDTSKKGEMKNMSMAKKLAWAKRKRTPITNLFAAVGLKAFAADAEPEELMDAMEEMAKEQQTADEDDDVEEQDTAKKMDSKQTGDEGASQDPAVAALTEKVEQLTTLVTQLVQNKKGAAPEDAIDAAIADLEQQTGDNDEEESHTIPAGAMDDDGPVTDPEDRPQSALDNAYKIEALRAVKPIIAAIPDPVQRKLATDAAIASIKSKSTKNSYASINKGQRQTAKDKQTPTTTTQDHSDLGRNIAKQHNPHYKKRS